MRLIDADLLLTELRNDLNCDGGIYNSYTEKIMRDDKYAFAIECVDDAPTVEAEPVRHGHWEQGYISNEDGSISPIDFDCSVCGQANDIKSNYYPHCGAKMDLSGEDNV